MSKRSPSSITNLWILSGIIVFLGLSGWFLAAQAPLPKQEKQNRFYRDLSAAQELLAERWELGDVEGAYELGKISCPDLVQNGQKIHTSYFQCNPYYMLCFLRGQTEGKLPENFEMEGHGFDKRGRLEVGLKHSISGRRASIRFIDVCGNILLPASVYSAGPLESTLLIWDNVGQDVRIDKNYVNNGEVKIWLEALGNKSEIKVADFHRPSISLELEKKKNYCQFKGGQLLQSRYLDAATFLPSKGKGGYVYKFPYPWSKRRDALERLGTKDCDKIFTSECDKENFQYHSTYSPSWAGIYQALGSYAEVLDNKFHPRANLKVSSMLLPLSSPWHKLGVRGSSDRAAELSAYNGRALEQGQKEIRSAFRCVYYR